MICQHNNWNMLQLLEKLSAQAIYYRPSSHGISNTLHRPIGSHIYHESLSGYMRWTLEWISHQKLVMRFHQFNNLSISVQLTCWSQSQKFGQHDKNFISTMIFLFQCCQVCTPWTIHTTWVILIQHILPLHIIQYVTWKAHMLMHFCGNAVIFPGHQWAKSA